MLLEDTLDIKEDRRMIFITCNQKPGVKKSAGRGERERGEGSRRNVGTVIAKNRKKLKTRKSVHKGTGEGTLRRKGPRVR